MNAIVNNADAFNASDIAVKIANAADLTPDESEALDSNVARISEESADLSVKRWIEGQSSGNDAVIFAAFAVLKPSFRSALTGAPIDDTMDSEHFRNAIVSRQLRAGVAVFRDSKASEKARAKAEEEYAKRKAYFDKATEGREATPAELSAIGKYADEVSKLEADYYTKAIRDVNRALKDAKGNAKADLLSQRNDLANAALARKGFNYVSRIESLRKATNGLVAWARNERLALLATYATLESSVARADWSASVASHFGDEYDIDLGSLLSKRPKKTVAEANDGAEVNPIDAGLAAEAEAKAQADADAVKAEADADADHTARRKADVVAYIASLLPELTGEQFAAAFQAMQAEATNRNRIMESADVPPVPAELLAA